MKWQHWFGLFLTLSIIGCQAPAPTTQPAPTVAGPEEIERIRASYKAQNPHVDVGVVQDVLPAENLAAVGDVNVANYKNGDVVCFIDATTAPLVCGQVVRVTENQVHVKYEDPVTGKRAPMRGDLGVAFR